MRQIMLAIAMICALPLLATGAGASEFKAECELNRKVSAGSQTQCVYLCTDGSDRVTMNDDGNECFAGFAVTHNNTMANVQY